MPRQVLAEEIERFLETVEGVASVRLLTSPSGEIDQIYVTADDDTEARAARRSAVAALMTHYGIPVEPWRVHVAQLKRFSPAELPDLRILSVEETMSAAETTARVQVVLERAGTQRTGTGQARGPSGAQHRVRTLAAATVDAVRAVVDPPHRRLAVQHVLLTTCMDRPVVLVAITAAGPRGQEAFVGAAFQDEETAAATVAASLDAVTKWLLRATLNRPEAEVEMDRRARLEAMRHAIRFRGGGRPGAAQPALEPAGAASSATSSSSMPGSAEVPPPTSRPVEPAAERADAPSRDRAPQGASAPDARERTLQSPPVDLPAGTRGDDILDDLREIRPEQTGGAVVAAHHEGPRVGTSSRPGRQVIEDDFLQSLVDGRTPVHIRCRDGYEIPRAVLRDIGIYSVVVEAGEGTELVYKHSIISIRPSGARA